MRRRQQFVSVSDGEITAIHEPGKDIVLNDERIGWRTLLLWLETSRSDLTRRGLAELGIQDEPAGDVVTFVPAQVGDAFVSIDGGTGPADTWTTRAFTALERAAHRADAKAKVKSLAQQRITALAPEWRQRNVIARGLELTRKELGGASLTSAEQSEVSDGESLWTAVKAIRSHSDTVEAQIDAASSRAAIDALVDGISWP